MGRVERSVYSQRELTMPVRDRTRTLAGPHFAPTRATSIIDRREAGLCIDVVTTVSKG
jgi:hypothetical protein